MGFVDTRSTGLIHSSEGLDSDSYCLGLYISSFVETYANVQQHWYNPNTSYLCNINISTYHIPQTFLTSTYSTQPD